MTTIYYPGSHRLSKNLINPFEFSNIPVSEKISQAISQITFGIKSILDVHGNSALLEITSQFGEQNEGEIREILKNYQNTFPIFQKSLLKGGEETIKGKKVSVEIYVHDLNNPEIVQIMKELKESGTNPELLILDIKKDDYGILNSVTIGNLKRISNLGFSFSIDGFSIEDDNLTANQFEKLAEEDVYPEYIKITKDMYTSIVNKTIQISQKVTKLLWIIKRKGIKLLAKDTNKNNVISDVSEAVDIPDFLSKASVKDEDMLSIDGSLYAQEGLISFAEGVNTMDGLKILKEKNLTGELMKLMIKHATKEVRIGKKRSINIYLKDLGGVNFIQTIENMCMDIPMSLRGNLIFEILEDTYGSINNQVIRNIKTLQKLGFSIAIDDLYFGCDKNSMSKEILETIHEEGLIPKYLKIDGRHSMGIKDGNIPPHELRYLREIIGQFSKLHESPIFIIEWIQDTEHAKQIIRAINLPGIQLLFQGRNISHGNFGADIQDLVLGL